MKRLIILAAILATSLNAQPLFDSGIPAPKQVTGYELGDRFTPHSVIEKYVRLVRDADSGRVRIEQYGQTYEGRSLYIVIVSSKENIKRLDDIRLNIQKLADPRITSVSEAEKIIGSSPALVWLSYGVHGNEASSPEAAMQVLYELVARKDSEMASMLDNVVVVIDPLLNPDGHERYVNFQTSRSGVKPVDDRYAAEHSEDWPGSRTNHYLFDLNRDWSWLTQKETQARVRIYQQWKPQVHADFHEMGYNSTYFFFPSFKPVNKNLPKSTIEWGGIYGKANAAAFDINGWSYWSGEVFDLFYPGFGDSWPSLNGAIGMTYEQGGGVGVRIKRSDETTLTLKDRIDHHRTTSVATVKTTSDNRKGKLKDFYRFFSDAVDEGKNGAIKAYIVDPTKDPVRAAKLISLLKQQGIEVLTAKKEFSSKKLNTYFQKPQISKKFPAGTYIIDLGQPAKRLISALMEEEPAMSDTFFYDISTWSLPVAYGIEAYWTGQVVDVDVEKVDDVPLPKGSVIAEKPAYAYTFKLDSNNGLKVLAWLLQHDYKANVAMREYVIDGEKFGRGSIIIPVNGNDTGMLKTMNELAGKYHVKIYAAKSGYTEKGINLGSDRAVRLKKPKIIIVTGSPVSAESYGSLWSLFDNEYGIDFVPVKADRLRHIDLHDYTALIFPDDWGNGSGYTGLIDSATVQKIKTWISGGGTYIGIDGGAAFASGSVGKIASVKFKEKNKEEKKDEKKGDKTSDEELEKRMTVEERQSKERLSWIPGTMVRVKLDNSHPLGFGYDSVITVLKSSNTMYELASSGYNVGIYSKSPRLSGFMSDKNEKMLEDTPYLIHEKSGAGNIILFADDPNFRLFWDGLNRIFLNAVLLMPSIRDVTMTSD